MNFKLGFIGAGAMAEAIIKGTLAASIYKPSEIIVSDINQQRLDELNNTLGVAISECNGDIIKKSDIIVLAVKPQYVEAILVEGKNSFDPQKIVISIAAGITTKTIENAIGKAPVIRVMPNTPALIGAGMSALCKGLYANEEQLDLAVKIFNGVGETVKIGEELIDGVTGVSGSGPAYVYQFIEAMADGGVKVGLPRDLAYQLAAQTVVGAGLMVLKTGMHPGQLKDMVTSPGGTTIRGISVLEKAGVRGAVMDAVEESYKWSKIMGTNK